VRLGCHELQYGRHILFADLVETPGLLSCWLAGAGPQISDPHIAAAVPEMARHIRIHRVMRERCATRTVAMEHHDRWLCCPRMRVTREPHHARNGFATMIVDHIGHFRGNGDGVDLCNDGATARNL